MLYFELPYPPSVNHYWRIVRGRMRTSREGKAFREKVCAILAASGTQPLSGRLAVHVILFPPDRRRRDIDNVQKALFDALEQGRAYHDDAQIESLRIVKASPVPGGRVIVTIKETRDAEAAALPTGVC